MNRITIYMSPLEPSTVKSEGRPSSVSTEDGKIGIPLLPLDRNPNKSGLSIAVGLREDWENSIFQVLKGDSLEPPYWERTTYDVGVYGGTETNFEDSITISGENPTGNIEAVPYWNQTKVDAKNPGKVYPHYPFIVAYSKQDPSAFYPEEGETWLHTVPSSFEHEESQPIVVPGEYIRTVSTLLINGKYFSISNVVKYETPLLTGGWIKSKEGIGTNTTYTVEIYGEEVSGIPPTDFFPYKVGEWVYLLKSNVYGSAEEDVFGNKKFIYGSSDITDVSKTNNISPMLQMVNAYRAENDLYPFSGHPLLEKSAQAHADDMAENQYYSHTGLNGSTPYDRIADTGYFTDAENEAYAENIAQTINYKASSAEILQGWKDSPPHNAAILSESTHEFGYGMAAGPGSSYLYVQNFGSRGASVVTPNQNYRLAPFNLGGLMDVHCAVPWQKAIRIDSATRFSKVFDLQRYEGTIIDLNKEDSTAIVDIPGASEHTLPIFYYCEQDEEEVEPTIDDGVDAFESGDTCVIEKPNFDSWDDAKVIGFPVKPKSCEVKYILYRTSLYYRADFSRHVHNSYSRWPSNPSNYSTIYDATGLSTNTNCWREWYSGSNIYFQNHPVFYGYGETLASQYNDLEEFKSITNRFEAIDWAEENLLKLDTDDFTVEYWEDWKKERVLWTSGWTWVNGYNGYEHLYRRGIPWTNSEGETAWWNTSFFHLNPNFLDMTFTRPQYDAKFHSRAVHDYSAYLITTEGASISSKLCDGGGNYNSEGEITSWRGFQYFCDDVVGDYHRLVFPVTLEDFPHKFMYNKGNRQVVYEPHKIMNLTYSSPYNIYNPIEQDVYVLYKPLGISLGGSVDPIVDSTWKNSSPGDYGEDTNIGWGPGIMTFG